MLAPFFVLAAVSPGRQHAFRSLVCAHLAVVGIGVAACCWEAGNDSILFLGHVLLVAGIVEGALLLGWRLTQLPKSQALEFLLVSPLRPPLLFGAEVLVGLTRLLLVTLSSLPFLCWLVIDGRLYLIDLVPLLVLPLTWGTITGLGLTTWAFEPQGVRRWGERFFFLLVLVYLLIGVLAGERLRQWVEGLPGDLGEWFMTFFQWWHQDNPFGLIKYWLENDPFLAWPRLLSVQVLSGVLVGVLWLRAAGRLQGHFHERHYQPVEVQGGRKRGSPAERPLAWWAVRRVTAYSGRINLWLAGGFGLLYAVYIMAGPAWPSWLGRQVFQVCDRAGGIPTLMTALVVLAAVPAAFQYGLWDSSVQDRCRRLELLLLSRLEARDYWEAAWAAAWQRGRGYFAVAVFLAGAAVVAGQASWSQMILALAAGVILWGLYFALGFRAFAKGMQANALGLLLTVGLPGGTYLLYQLHWPMLGAWLPPGSIFQATTTTSIFYWLPGVLANSAAGLVLARLGLARADIELRSWFDKNQGNQVVE